MFTVSSFAQTEIKTKEYYLSKSKHQRTIGWIMLGGGAGLTGVGLAVAQAETNNYALGTSSNSIAGAVLIVAGAASAIGSIPFFISAAHNKRTAASLGFNMQKAPALYTLNNQAIFQPVLILKVAL